jgi:hypothetical protein
VSAGTFVTRTYTPLAFRETTERWLIAALATMVAVLWLFVIPLEIVLHDSASPAAATPTANAAGG